MRGGSGHDTSNIVCIQSGSWGHEKVIHSYCLGTLAKNMQCETRQWSSLVPSLMHVSNHAQRIAHTCMVEPQITIYGGSYACMHAVGLAYKLSFSINMACVSRCIHSKIVCFESELIYTQKRNGIITFWQRVWYQTVNLICIRCIHLVHALMTPIYPIICYVLPW